MRKVTQGLSILIGPRFFVFLLRKAIGWLRGLVAEFESTRHGSILVGKQVYVHPTVIFQVGRSECVHIGDHTSVNAFTVLIGNIRIERYCLVSVSVFMSSGDHNARLFPSWIIRNQDDWADNHDKEQVSAAPIHIEEDVWVGWGVFIRKGTYIGRGAIIGAGTIVTRDVPPYSIQAGAPNREIGRRLAFSPPACIDADNESHWPYFYNGFLLRTEQLALSRPRRVLFATDRVRLILQGGTFTGLQLSGLLGTRTGQLSLLVLCNGIALGELVITRQQFECGLSVPSTVHLESGSRSAVLAGFNEVELRIAAWQPRPGSSGLFGSKSEDPLYGLSTVSLRFPD